MMLSSLFFRILKSNSACTDSEMFFSKGGRGWEKGVPDGYLSLPEGLRHIFGN